MLVVRGTDSFADVIIDVNSDLVPIEGSEAASDTIQVHDGFYGAWRSIELQALAIVDAIAGDLPRGDFGLSITGHSLGAGVATIAGHIVALNRQGGDEIGSGRVGEDAGPHGIRASRWNLPVTCGLPVARECFGRGGSRRRAEACVT